MKLERTSFTTPALSSDTVKAIFPVYGTKALDVPSYDSEKHMYIVDQAVTVGGHRQITYVAVGCQITVEATLVFFHSWTIMSKLRLMIPDGTAMKVVKTFDWPLTTYYDFKELKAKVAALAQQYATDNIGMVGGEESKELTEFVSRMVDDLFLQDAGTQARENGFAILKAYCRQMKVCSDFVNKL